MGRRIQLASDTQAIDFAATALGVHWRKLNLAGWDGSPGSTLALTQRPRDIGAWSSEAFLGPRQGIVLSGMIAGSDPGAVLRAFDALNAAADIIEATLTVTDDGIGDRTMTVARQGDVIPTQFPSNLHKGFAVQMVAEDPRKYAEQLSVGPIAPPSSVGGLTLPFTVPFTIDAVVTRSGLSFTNTGNVVAPCVLRFDGPTSGFTFLHRWDYRGGGEETFSTELAIASGQYALLGPDNDQFELMGQSSRIGTVTQRAYVRLWPGANYFTYNGTGGTLTYVRGAQGAWL